MDTSHLPPDGTYPPRILAPSASIWLKDGETLDVSGKSVIFRRVGKDFYVAPHPTAKHEAMLNGIPMIVERLLKDGDFIHCGKERYIFQADPVADWRKFLSEDDSVIETYQPTKAMQKWIIIDSDGVSLDGGKTRARWDEIKSIFASGGVDSPIIKISLYSDGRKKRKLASKLPQFMKYLSKNKVSIRQFAYKVFLTMPFQLNWEFPEDLATDVYLYAVYIKLLRPAEEQGKLLPADFDFITGDDERKRALRFDLLGMAIFLPIASAVMAVITMWKEGEIDWGRNFRGYFLAQLILWIGFFVFASITTWLFMKLSQFIRMRANTKSS
jgi:hypothetical protein